MAAAAARRGLTAPLGEVKTGSRPVEEAEGRSATARCVEMLLLVGVLVQRLLVNVLALVPGVSSAARELMPMEVGPFQWAHSVCSRTPMEVTSAGSRAVNTEATAAMVGNWQARANDAAVHVQRHARGFAARQYYFGRVLGRAIVEQRAANAIVQAALRWRQRRHGCAVGEAEARAAATIQAAARRRSCSQEFLELRVRLRLYWAGRRRELQACQAHAYVPDALWPRWHAAFMAASKLYDKTPHGRTLLTVRVRRQVVERFATSIEAADAAAAMLQRAWRASAAAACTRALEELWAEPLPLAAQLMCNRWRASGGDKVAVHFARMAAITDKNTHVGWARFLNGHAVVLQRAWRASTAAATWRARCRAVVRVQRTWRAVQGHGPAKQHRRKPQSAKKARAQKARARAPQGGRV